MVMTLTENAAKKILAQLIKNGKGIGLRVGVKKVGCSGFAYTFAYAEAVGADDQVFDSHNARLVVDTASLPFLDGAQLDFVKDGFNETFKFNNPNAASECGCGESFNLKKDRSVP
ncbi:MULTISPECIES: iron-sulfur cluster assembly accessory protein [unclassified Undibacterium]|uniref:HesB/IscA family protein n=1 Tax=unclassified Undibacterium TaxID=2630295 RepID=UPI002AC9243E|nr:MULTISPECIES: iron-sulfur cluster assembly accessory protein [unclassified Undibacterium]MEB0138526.1 iron-sulfur cluster assembly accessory protein [Undibacterium sp. CCC2.1]MEB0173073.1 iron-sulfur cluster assembly accessory protein [Undibacterium sp. CCC1.1]MEB0176125.1 iron-sulfur cluster assembly accessory protein [Undibacterium sp. CCC3.4]MEB0215391.1 iron-sulfur cluster assembly accessory protein [Undibacterium sp. 5I2]WPX42732.1 iron-sulfur cluster assembly accessory protein [Undiba